MNYRWLIPASITLFLGALYCAINYRWIIVRHPFMFNQKNSASTIKKTIKKRCILYYWHDGRWLTEQREIILSNDRAYTIKQLINNWLALLDDEQLLPKKISLDSAMISSSGQELFLSFSRNLIGKEETLFEKWMRIEGLLKTIQAHDSTIQNVRFLVHHQPLQDTQLDFSCAWPIHGFCKAT